MTSYMCWLLLALVMYSPGVIATHPCSSSLPSCWLASLYRQIIGSTAQPTCCCCTSATREQLSNSRRVSQNTSGCMSSLVPEKRYHTHPNSRLYLPRTPNIVCRRGFLCLRSLLAVQTGTTLHICQRGVLQRRICGSLAAAQLSSHEVAVESLSGAATIKIKANLQIRGDLPPALISLESLTCFWSV